MTKILLSAGPSGGKSALAYALEDRGHIVMPEIALWKIQEEEIKTFQGKVVEGDRVVPWERRSEFQSHIYARQVSMERSIQVVVVHSWLAGRPVFFDSGLGEMKVNCDQYSIQVPGLEDSLASAKYAHIFLLEPLPRYCWDHPEGRGPRKQPYENAHLFHAGLRRIYSEYGLRYTEVPHWLPAEGEITAAMKEASLKARVYFVESRLRDTGILPPVLQLAAPCVPQR